MRTSIPPQSVSLATKRRFLLPKDLTERLNRRNVVPISVALTLLVGIGDYATGVETTFTLLYIFPIVLAVWFRGPALGMVLGVVSAACTAATAMWSITKPRLVTIAWNEGGALGIFFTIVFLVDSLRKYVEREHRERLNAVEQLRHSERLNMIGKLAAGVAHELGTPLNVIAGSAELLTEPNGTKRIHEFASTILEQTARMTLIIRQLLDFGRRAGTERRDVNLASIAHDAVALLSLAAKKRGIMLEVRDPNEVVTVSANRAELEQVIGNLIMNGMQSMSAGGTLRVRAESRTVGPHGVHAGGEYGCLCVEDEGVGIEAENLPRIFDPFFTTKGVGEGTGLGLSVSYGIVRDHGGFIEVESEVGRGSRFYVFLPKRTTSHAPSSVSSLRSVELNIESAKKHYEVAIPHRSSMR